MQDEFKGTLSDTIKQVIEADVLSDEEAAIILEICHGAINRSIADLSEQVLKARIEQDATGGEIQ